MHRYANPARFKSLSAKIRPVAVLVLTLTLFPGLYLGLFDSPQDGLQGQSVRIMYIHVPSAWMALFTYVALAVASFISLVWKHPLATLSAKAMAPIGLVFTALALITGSLWGKPTWGTYWIWDGRLTSVLVLFFLYLGYIALWHSVEDEEKAGRVTSLLALVGAINIPVIKFSVDWWSTLHQPASVLTLEGPKIHADMLTPLLLMAVAFKAYFVIMLLDRIALEMDRRKRNSMADMLSASAHYSGHYSAYNSGSQSGESQLPLERQEQ